MPEYRSMGPGCRERGLDVVAVGGHHPGDRGRRRNSVLHDRNHDRLQNLSLAFRRPPPADNQVGELTEAALAKQWS